MIELRQLFDLYMQRKERMSPLHAAAEAVGRAYYGDIVLPIPELDRAEKPLVANLIYQGGEQRAMRVASTMPDVQYPSMDPGKPRADQRARQRRLVNLAWWDDDQMRIKLRKRARYMVFYACTPVVIRPNFKENRPTWQVHNPLTTFAPEMDVGEMSPPDVIFTYSKSLSWLQRTYPEQSKKINLHPDPAISYVCLQYMDEHEYVTAVIGEKYQPPAPNSYDYQNAPGSPDGEIVELDRVPNRIGRVPTVVAGRIGLDRPRGEFDGVVGLYQAQARLMALMMHGMQRAVYPEEWLVDNPNDPNGAQIVTHADPMHGVTGRITGGTLQTVHPLPEALGSNFVDRLERAVRIESGTPAELGGESTSNVRTGRRGDSILSAVLDFPIQEEQELLEVSLREECRIAIEIDKAYFPTSKSIYLSGSAGMISYEATDFWSGLQNLWVKYAHAGVDAQGLPVELGQRIGMGIMSKRTAMEIDPLNEDPEGEFDRMNSETLRAGMLAGIAGMTQDPATALIVAKVMKKLREGDMEIEDAVIEANELIKAEQAEQAAQMAAPDMANPQPGMAQPEAIAEPPASSQNLTALLAGLHTQSRTGQVPGGGATLEGAAAR